MTTLLLRSALIYIILMIAMRMMGKRQIGELEISDLITTLLISEIAALPLTDHDIPISHAVVPIIFLMTVEVVTSTMVAGLPRIKNWITARPAMLIKDGVLCQKEMQSARISTDELISELRQKDITDPSEVSYAILEQSGKISIITKPKNRPPTVEQSGIEVKDNGIYHIVIDQGVLNRHALDQLSLSEQEVEAILASRRLQKKDVYLLMIDDARQISLIRKEGKP